MLVGVVALLHVIHKRLCHIQCHLGTNIQYDTPPHGGGSMVKMMRNTHNIPQILDGVCNCAICLILKSLKGYFPIMSANRFEFFFLCKNNVVFPPS